MTAADQTFVTAFLATGSLRKAALAIGYPSEWATFDGIAISCQPEVDKAITAALKKSGDKEAAEAFRTRWTGKERTRS